MINFLRNGISISQFLITILIFEFLFLVIGYSLFGWTVLFDLETLIYSGLIVLLISLGSFYSNKSEPIVAILAFFTSVFIFSRLICYLYIPLEIYFPYPLLINTDDVNRSLLYVFMGNAFILLGTRLGSLFFNRINFKSIKIPKVKLPTSTVPILFVVLLFSWLELYITNTLGVNLQSVTSEKQQSHLVRMLFRTLVGTDVCFTFLLALIFVSEHRMKKTLYLVVAFTYFTFLTLGGSKGAIFRLDIILLTHCVALYLKRKFSVKTFLLVLVVNVIVAQPVFLAIQVLRDKAEGSISLLDFKNAALRNHKLKNSKPLEYIHKNGNVISGKIKTSEKWDIIREGTFYRNDVLPLVSRSIMILNRLGMLDYIVIALNKGNQSKINEVYSFSYFWKSVVNILLPGEPYQDAEFRTERMFPYVFNQEDKDYVRENFNTEPLTLWAAGFTYMGYFGGLILILIVCFILQAGYLFFRKSNSPLLRVISLVYLLTFQYGILGNFGLDNIFTLLCFISIQIAIIIILYSFICKLYFIMVNYFKRDEIA